MNDPPRLRDRSHNPLISEMLSAAGRELPRRRALNSTLLAAATAASVVGGQATAGAAIAGTTAASLAKLAVKWTLLSAVVVGGGVAGVESSGVLRERGVATVAAGATINHGVSVPGKHARSAARSEPPAGTEHVVAFPDALPPETAPSPPPVSAPGPSPPPVSAPGPARTRQSTSWPVQGERIEQELALLDHARRALNQGRYADVDGITARYLADYPRGRLEQEARYLNMQAARHRGDSARAEAEAKALLELNPNGPHAKAAREVQAAVE